MAPLHQDLEPLAFLLGTWRGEGKGEYPTIDPFDYGEELTFEHVGDTFLLYAAVAAGRPQDGAPIHFERGFLRPGDDGRVEFTLAHPIGLTEVAEGSLDGTAFELASTAIGRTGTGMDAISVVRRYRRRRRRASLRDRHGDRATRRWPSPDGRAASGPT